MWGGYYGQAYYPSVNNAFTPASCEATRINVPVFRMLGSDPILQYDYKCDPQKGLEKQKVITLEPAYSKDGGGGDPKWVDWYVKENFSGKCLTFAYTQAGQENSFSWRVTKRGIKYQYPLFAALRKEGKIEVETIGQTGKWFKETYPDTPPSTIVAEGDWQGNDKKSYWYDCKNYRLNFYVESGVFRIRDCYLFRDEYKERYLGAVCATNDLYYDNLPLIDGVRFTKGDFFAGVYFEKNGKMLTCKNVVYKENDNEVVLIAVGTEAGDVTLTLSPEKIMIKSSGVTIRPKYGEIAKNIVSATVSGNKATLMYNNYSYSVTSNVPFEKDYSLTGERIEIDVLE